MTEIAPMANFLTPSADASRRGIWRRLRSDSAGHRHPSDCAASYDAPEARRCAHKVGSATHHAPARFGTAFDRILGRVRSRGRLERSGVMKPFEPALGTPVAWDAEGIQRADRARYAR